jgi:hypothetical protein
MKGNEVKSSKIIITGIFLCILFNGCHKSGGGNTKLDTEIKSVLESKTGQDAYLEMTKIATDYEINKGYESLSPIGKILYNVYWVEAEVNNGGFNQYFYNSSGDHAMDAVQSLDQIGASLTKELLQSAIHRFPNSSVPSDRDERIKILNSIDPNKTLFDNLDGRFYDLSEDRMHLTVEYVKSNLQ